MASFLDFTASFVEKLIEYESRVTLRMRDKPF